MADSDIQAALKKAAGKIQDRAQTLSGWSTHIPPSINVRSDGDDVLVYSRLGQAIAFELGHRHPLNWPSQRPEGSHWGNTPRRPFLEPATRQQNNVVVQELSNVVVNWAQKLGYKK